ncbi:hypothetical protein AB0N81_34445 [Streptomyces sp. NPDC093510]|uniref:hypothetical protein n=1 Tax=Streptomyces sp. NPDC093510 TaxID=3155199 RepID=UPI00341BBB12
MTTDSELTDTAVEASWSAIELGAVVGERFNDDVEAAVAAGRERSRDAHTALRAIAPDGASVIRTALDDFLKLHTGIPLPADPGVIREQQCRPVVIHRGFRLLVRGAATPRRGRIHAAVAHVHRAFLDADALLDEPVQRPAAASPRRGAARLATT